VLPDVEPIFITLETLLALQEDLLRADGGLPGHKQALAESIVAYPQQKYAYADPQPTVQQLAAYLAFAVAKFHAFTDGNKRTAAASMELFLNQNGFIWTATDEEAIPIIEGLAGNAGDDAHEAEFVKWVVAHSELRK
jgi:death-on-curing protein